MRHDDPVRARVRVADSGRDPGSERVLQLHAGLFAAGRLNARVDRRDRHEHAWRERRKHVRKHWRARLRGGEHGGLVFGSVALHGVRRRAQRNAIEVHARVGAKHRPAAARRVRDSRARRDIVGIELNRIGQPLQVVP